MILTFSLLRLQSDDLFLRRAVLYPAELQARVFNLATAPRAWSRDEALNAISATTR